MFWGIYLFSYLYVFSNLVLIFFWADLLLVFALHLTLSELFELFGRFPVFLVEVAKVTKSELLSKE